MKEKDSENLEKEDLVESSACKTLTKVFKKILLHTNSLYTNILKNQLKCFFFYL